MSENKKFLVDYKNSSEESNDISTSYSSSEDNDIECRISKNMDIQDFEFLVERSHIFQKTENLYENILDKAFVMSNDVVLYYILLFDYSKSLSFFEKKIKKIINNILNDKNINKNNLYIINTNILCGIDSKYIYDAIKSIELKYENYIFLSKCSYVDKKDKEDLKDCFKNIKHEDFDFIPDCIEEIFLLTVSQYWRSTVFYDKPYRVFLLNKKEMVEYLEKLKEEVNC